MTTALTGIANQFMSPFEQILMAGLGSAGNLATNVMRIPMTFFGGMLGGQGGAAVPGGTGVPGGLGNVAQLPMSMMSLPLNVMQQFMGLSGRFPKCICIAFSINFTITTIVNFNIIISFFYF